MKIITENQKNGELGETLAKARFLQIGLVYEGHGRLESGLDGMVELRDPASGHTTARYVGAQVKTLAGGKYTAETSETFEYLMKPDDVMHWRGASVPVIVVFCRLSDGGIWWKPISEHVPGETRRLRIDKQADRLDASAVERIAALTVDGARPGVWVPARVGGEPGVLNLFPVRLPDELFVSVASHPNGRAAAAALGALPDARHDWVQRGDRVISFHDPRGESTGVIVETDTVEAVDAAEVCASCEIDDDNDVADLLRRCLIRQFEDDLYYARIKRRHTLAFRSVGFGRRRVYRYQSAKRPAEADVVAVYRPKNEPDRIDYVRHHAFHPRFERLGTDWYLVVEPTYTFTYDGYRPHQRAHGLLTGKKKLEKNQAFWGQVLMWQHLLTTGGPSTTSDLLSQGRSTTDDALTFGPAERVELPLAPPEAAWDRHREATNASTQAERQEDELVEGNVPSEDYTQRDLFE